MAQKKFDGVVEAVRYSPEGKVRYVRVFLRRGPTWSDRLLLSRDDFIHILKTGKRMMVGKRIEFMGGSFDISEPVHIKGPDGQEVLYTGEPADGRDRIEGAPIF